MRAVQIDRFGGPEILQVSEVPEPEPQDGAGLRELSDLVDQGALRPRVDSAFHVDAVRDAHERFAQGNLRGKVTMTF